MNNRLDGYAKSACLLFFLGIEKSLEILKHLDKSVIKKIIYKLLEPDILSKDNIEISLNDYKHSLKNILYKKKKDKNNYLNSILFNIFDKKEINVFLNKIKNKKLFFKNVNKISLYNYKDVYMILKKEHPQIVSILLTYLENKKVVKILSLYKRKYRFNILHRMLNFKGIKKNFENEFFIIINSLFAKKKKYKKNKYCYIKNLLNFFSKQDKIYMLKNIFKDDNKIKKKIICQIFSFEDIFYLNDNNIYVLLKYINKKILYKSIYNLPEKFKKKFLINMSKKQLNYFIKNIGKEHKDFSLNKINISKKNVVKMLKTLLKKNVLLLKDLEKIYD
ncbi:FliG C-terminal domain-containing protein [Buchnera aphidicola (Ceratoglyphina bambusae)]|uniref:FliG C-terminal domain-containing protein n=1 Tax=Buchnera aphidicola TaxID=9 RepID=UPI0031B81FBF